jgi:ankyrin repeat protein
MNYRKLTIVPLVIVGICAALFGARCYHRAHLKQIVLKHFGNGDGGKLVYAALTGDEKGLEKCLSQGVPIDVTETNGGGLTALNIAIIQRNRDAVLMLLQHGANPNLADANGTKPVGIAIDYSVNNDTWFLETLIKHGADPNAGLTYMHIYPSLAMVKVMVEAGANVNGTGDGNKPPLIGAAILRYYDIVYYLLEHGADPKIKDHLMGSILDCIHSEVNYEPKPGDDESKVIEWLKQHNAWKEKDELWREEHMKPQS